jgi:hypothetical protein
VDSRYFTATVLNKMPFCFGIYLGVLGSILVIAPNRLLREHAMSRRVLGSICGIVFGLVSVATMIPLHFDDKRAAVTSAFINRFAIGFVIGAATLPVAGWLSGLIFGLLLSLPDAIITKAYAPILSLGMIGGVIIGVVVSTWGG